MTIKYFRPSIWLALVGGTVCYVTGYLLLRMFFSETIPLIGLPIGILCHWIVLYYKWKSKNSVN